MKITFWIVSLFVSLFLLSCAGSMKGLKSIDEPLDEGILVTGNILVENINQTLEFDNWDFASQLVIVGRDEDGTTTYYDVMTDNRGYFALANVPSGAYGIKAIIIPLFGQLPLKLVNPLDAPDSKFYRMRHPERDFERKAVWLPAKQTGRITNLRCTWLGLRVAEIEGLTSEAIGDVFRQTSSGALKNKQFWTEGYIYNREEPLQYLKQKFPESAWWK